MQRANLLVMLMLSTIFTTLVVGCGPPREPKRSNRLAPGPVDSDAPEEFSTTESGLKYRIRRKFGEGIVPKKGDVVRIHYRGWMDSGTVFDTTYGKRPISMKVSEFVPGFAEGLQLIGVGGMIELEIPGELGYGPTGYAPSIPPNATLHFIVEMEEVTRSFDDD